MFQIFTEDRNRQLILDILNRHLQAYTLLFGEGSWRGKNEPCITAQFINVSREVIDQIAREIKEVNSQEAVLIIEYPAAISLVN